MSSSTSPSPPGNGGDRGSSSHHESKRFIMDYSMSKIAKYLRLLGYDTFCRRGVPQDQLLRIASAEGRCLVTCSRSLEEQVEAHNRGVQRRQAAHVPRTRRVVAYDSDGDSVYSSDAEPMEEVVVRCVWVTQWRSQDFQQMMIDLIGQLGLKYSTRYVFSRCVTCNDMLLPVEKTTIQDRVDPRIYKMYKEFTRCPACLKVFWGFDGERVINYKSLRTLELLRSLCVSAGADTSEAGADLSNLRCFRSFPRRVKTGIFSFLLDSDLDTMATVFPALKDLVEEVRVCNREGREPPLFREIRSRK